MNKNIKKLLLFSFIFVVILAISLNVNAATIKETTNTNDQFDTIEDGTIVVGISKFTPNKIITGVRVAEAGANDLKIYEALNGSDKEYSYPQMFYFMLGDWYEFNEDGELSSVKDITSLDIYYVNNEAKKGVTIPTNTKLSELEGKIALLGTQLGAANKNIAEKNDTIDELEKENKKMQEQIDLLKAELEKLQVYFNTVSYEGADVAAEMVVRGEKATKPEDPIKEGYIFKGWKLNDAEYDFDSEVTEDITLVADWKSKTAEVDTLEKLEAAVADKEIDTVKLTGDIKIDKDKSIVVSRDLTIDGAGYTISKAETPAYVSGGPNYILKLGWAEANITVKNLKLTNSLGAIIVGEKATVTVEDVDVTGNVWGGIEVGKNGHLIVKSIKMDDEEYAKPLVWVDTNAKDTAVVEFEGATKIDTIGNQYQYYSNASMSIVSNKNVTSSITVPANTTLTIEDGVEVILDEDVEIKATEGQIKKEGTGTIKQKASTLEKLESALAKSYVDEVIVHGNLEIVDETILDLKGKTITVGESGTRAAAIAVIVNNGKLTITGNGEIVAPETQGYHVIVNNEGAELTVENGTFDALGHLAATLVNNGGTVTINGGTFKRSNEKGTYIPDSDKGNSYYTIDNQGTMIINNGTFNNSGKHSSLLRNGKEKLGATAYLTIKGGTFTGGINVVKNDENGVLVIEDGTFETSPQSLVMNWNVATIKGGTFNAVKATSAIVNGDWGADGKGELTVEGGTFNVKKGGYVITKNSGADNKTGWVKVKEGALSNPEDKICSGYTVEYFK